MKQSALLFVSVELMVEMCKPGAPRMLTVEHGIPKDAEFVGLIRTSQDMLAIQIESESFQLDNALTDAATGLPIIDPPPTFTVVYAQ